jgi:hypothetical protein
MARFKSERIIGTAALLAAVVGLGHLAPWLACGAAILMATIVVPVIALGLLLRTINRAPAERHPPSTTSRSLAEAPRVVVWR